MKSVGFSVSSEVMPAFRNVCPQSTRKRRASKLLRNPGARSLLALRGNSCRARASHPALQHFIVPFPAGTRRFEHLAQVRRRQVERAPPVTLGFCQPRSAHEPFELGQILRRELPHHSFHFSQCTRCWDSPAAPWPESPARSTRPCGKNGRAYPARRSPGASRNSAIKPEASNCSSTA